MRTAINKNLVLLLLGLSTVAVDQLSKFFAVAQLTSALEGQERLSDKLAVFYGGPLRDSGFAPKQPVSLLRGYWDFRYVENPGAAWGMLQKLPRDVRQPLFHTLGLVALVFLAWMFRRLSAQQTLLHVALSLVMGGAVGNFIDRLTRGFVVDFVDWHWRENASLHWPTFNVADAAICVGVTLMLLDSLRPREEAGAFQGRLDVRSVHDAT